MRLLDLFCGAGGAGMGYHRAGFEVVGVDHKPQKHYPFEFHCEDAFAFLRKHGQEFDVIHASPPCQAYSEATPMKNRAEHPALIGGTRDRLQDFQKPYVIENVENARYELNEPIMLCGTMFGLRVWRHRWFEIRPLQCFLYAPCNHCERPISVRPGSNARKRQGNTTHVVQGLAMGIDWMTSGELTEAIPPAYTEWIGKQLLSTTPPPHETPER